MNANVVIALVASFSILISACTKQQLSKEECSMNLSDPDYFHDALDGLTDVIVHDVFSPPVASRIYAYPCIAAYETIRQGYKGFNSLANQLNGLSEIPSPKDTSFIVFELAAIEAFLEVSQSLISSEDKLIVYRSQFNSKLDSLDVPERIRKDSKVYGELVANHIIEWSSKDKYKESRSYPKYTITDNPSEWKPTPPAYMEGIEPHWRAIRPMILKAADQFSPKAPTEFSMEKGSGFYNETMEVYETGNNASADQIAIASFWDCNPFVMNQAGHVMYATKKITPGGHWMGIAGIASKTAQHDLMRTIKTTTYVSIALFDGFISCWDEKYRSNLIRPETVINEYIDEEWKPILQTPPFPEHTSGHSVISTAAAVMLTSIFGEEFSYTDDVELKYGLPIRKYDSFMEASQEAAISRLYGGIHYMPAITDGVNQGRNVGGFIVEQLK